jgi:phage baseplate assembly protein W
MNQWLVNKSYEESMNIDFPFHFDSRGRTATTTDDEHIRDLIEQLLFTNPGERVNRPEFGSGLLQLVFAPNSPELAAALQFTMQAALQQWLGDVIQVHQLEVSSEDSKLRVTLAYAVLRTGEQRTDTFVQRSAA